MNDAPERIWAHYGLASPKKGHIWGGWNAIRNDNLTEYVRADLYAALEQERDELVALVGPALAQAKIDADENARLREAIREHKHSCVKCGDCDFWDRYEQRLTEGENDD